MGLKLFYRERFYRTCKVLLNSECIISCYTITGTLYISIFKSFIRKLVVYGDANADGKVDVADVVAVAAYVGSAENNKLTDEGLKNADVQGIGDGVTANDALAIQQYLAGSLKELPVKE